MSTHRPIIGITGGICSGKSEVARMLGELGCVVCVSDELARRVLDEPEVRARISALFGPAILAAEGSILRGELANLLFSNAASRSAIEAIMHPRIEALRRGQFAAASDAATGFVIDAPLLLEVALDRECDAVLFIDAPHELRVARAFQRQGWSREELDRRERAQLPLEKKRAQSTDVIQNDGDCALLRARVTEVFLRICARGRQTR